ncbi:MAG: DNA starvation/stationary phase protection protein [Actinobacteria bacterium]|nr:DNA starvation/stationary phase protection protein [Actinomycetota bacterium]MCG2800820.1 DNA starvation/stationary phase protection protein [Cellulomonas sp.]
MTTTKSHVDVRGDVLTGRQHGEHGAIASERLANHLQAILVDLLELANQGKQAHWNVVGPNFRDTHLHLDEIVEAAREHADVFAERLRALHALPDGRSTTVVASTTLPQYPDGEVTTAKTVDLVTARIDATAATLRTVHDEVDEDDPTSADLVHAAIADLEKLSWMLAAELRSPRG